MMEVYYFKNITEIKNIFLVIILIAVKLLTTGITKICYTFP